MPLGLPLGPVPTALLILLLEAPRDQSLAPHATLPAGEYYLENL